MHKTGAQHTIEYVMLISFVIAALVAVVTIFNRLNSGRLQQIQDYVTERPEDEPAK